jgi:hypothetical protein
MAKSNPALLIANHYQGSEAEPAAALDDLRHPIDVNELVGEFAVALFTPSVLPRFTCHFHFQSVLNLSELCAG